MGYSQFLLRDSYFWICLSSLGAAWALANGARFFGYRRRGGNATDGPLARDRYVIRCLLALSFMLACATAAIIFPDPQRILDSRLLLFFLIITGLAAVSVLFPLAVGLPLAIIGLPSLIFIAVAGATLVPLRGSALSGDRVGRLDVAAGDDGRLTIELRLGARARAISFDLQGEYVALEGSLLRYSSVLFFMGAEAGFRLNSVVGLGADGRSESDRYDCMATSSLIGGLQRLLVAAAGPLPGLSTAELRSMAVRPAIVDSFDVVVDSSGEMRLVAPHRLATVSLPFLDASF